MPVLWVRIMLNSPLIVPPIEIPNQEISRPSPTTTTDILKNSSFISLSSVHHLMSWSSFLLPLFPPLFSISLIKKIIHWNWVRQSWLELTDVCVIYISFTHDNENVWVREEPVRLLYTNSLCKVPWLGSAHFCCTKCFCKLKNSSIKGVI